MSEVSHRIDAPYDGISEVAPQVAIPSSCKAMLNCLARLPEGLSKRPPLTWLSGLPLAADKTISQFALTHVVPRGDTDLDLLLVINREGSSNIPYLYDLLTLNDRTADLTVSSDAQDYLDEATGANPHDDLRCATIEDTTFITNRRMVTANGVASQATRPYEAMIWVKVGGYGKVYKVVVDPVTGSTVTASYKTANGGNADGVPSAQTDRIAEGLFDGTTPTGASTPDAELDDLIGAGFTVTRIGSLIYIAHASNNFEITASDDTGGTAMVAIKGTVQRFSDLPAVATDGFIVRIAQEAAGGDSDYYVQFHKSGSTNQGYWQECLAPGTNLGLDPATMPLVMTTSDGGATWDLDLGPWTGRTTGNATLVPDPDFVGDTIQNITWHQSGRLSLLASKIEYLSASDSPYKFYPTTLAVAKDSDAFGLQSPLPSKASFKDALLFDRKLLILGDHVQGLVESADKVPTGGNTTITPAGKAPMTDQLRAQACAGKAYWAATKTNSLLIYELAVDRISGQTIPEDITPAIPTMLPLTLDRVCTHESLYMTLYGASGGSTLYVNLFRHLNGERQQNCWSPWSIPRGWTLVDMFFVGSALLVILKETASGLPQVFSMEMAPGNTDPYASAIVQYVDLRVHPTDSAYDAPSDTTTFTCPLAMPSILDGLIHDEDPKVTLMKGASADYPEAYSLPIAAIDGTTIQVSGDWTAIALDHIWVGRIFLSSFRPHTFYEPDPTHPGFPQYDGRLVIRKVTFEVSKFGYLAVLMLLPGREAQYTVYDGYNLSDVETPIGSSPPNKPTATFEVSAGGKNTEVTFEVYNDSHLGFFLTGYEWRGMFSGRSSRT